MTALDDNCFYTPEVTVATRCDSSVSGKWPAPNCRS